VRDPYDPGLYLCGLGWGEWIEADERGPRFQSFAFACPAEHIDAIYGSDRFPLGS
jgi:hypothetical protein